MSDPFGAMHDCIFAGPLAVDALLRGLPVRVFVTRNVQMLGDYAQVVGRGISVEIQSKHAAESGDSLDLVATSEKFELDAIVEDDGEVARWMVRPA